MRVAVIGGGPAGCAAAYRLRRQGHEPVLVESAPQLGGRSWTLREDGFTIDTGAFYVCSFYRRTLDVLEELGMRSSLVPMPDDTGLLDEGERRRWVVGSTGSVWGHPKLTLGDKLRLTVAGIRESIGRPDPFSTEALAGADDGRTVAEWAREAVGENAYQQFIRPSFEPWWLFGADKGVATLWTTLQRDAPGLKLFAVPGGTDSIARGLAGGVETRLSTEAAGIEANEAGVAVRTSGGDELRADAAVIATDAHAAAEILGSGPAADRLRRVPYAHATHVSLRYARNRWSSRPYSTHPQQPERHAAATVARVSGRLSTLVPRGAEVVDVYFSDAGSRALKTEDDAVRAATRAVDEFLGVPGPEPERAYVFNRPRGLPMPVPGHHGEMVRAMADLPPRVAIAGDYLTMSVLEGAIRTGDHAAGLVDAMGAPRRAAAPSAQPASA